MGDIIAGAFLIILTFGLFGFYMFVTRKMPEKRSLVGFISLLIFVGGLFGILLTFFNKHLLGYYPIIFALTLLFFTTQTAASYLYTKFPKIGLPILIFTFLLQTPIINSETISYRSQTLLSFNIYNYSSKIFDIEPGSYVSFFVGIPQDFKLGVNLIPILTAIMFIRVRKQTQVKNKHYT